MKKWLLIILKYASGLLIALLIFWGFYSFVKDENWLAITSLATLVLAIAAFWAIWQNYRFREKDSKERRLNEIIEWAEYIKNASVTPDVSASQKVRDANILMRYGTSFSRAISVETIISESFQRDLFEDFLNVIDVLAKFMCIRQYSTLHTLPSEQGFPRNAIDEVKKEISNNKPIEQLFITYATELTQSVNILLRKANKIKTELVK